VKYICTAILVIWSAFLVQATFASSPKVVIPKRAEGLYEEMSEYRKQRGLNKLDFNIKLYQSAYNKAKRIGEDKIEFEHGDWQKDIREYYSFKRAGEIMARNYNSFDATIDAWNDSPGHEEILNANEYCEIGIAEYKAVIVAHYGCRW